MWKQNGVPVILILVVANGLVSGKFFKNDFMHDNCKGQVIWEAFHSFLIKRTVFSCFSKPK